MRPAAKGQQQKPDHILPEASPPVPAATKPHPAATCLPSHMCSQLVGTATVMISQLASDAWLLLTGEGPAGGRGLQQT